MSTKAELLKLLDSNCGSFVSGENLARELGISRAAVNKAATSLKKSGYDILSRPSQGYLLRERVDLLTDISVSSGIGRPCKLKIFDSVDSVVNQAKKMDLGSSPFAVIAGEQKNARDKFGRPVISPLGSGLYLSIALKPSFDLDQAFFAAMASAMAVSRAIEDVCGINPKINWINDLYYQGKKICGIVTDAQTNIETGRIDKLIIGCVINCFPPKQKAGFTLVGDDSADAIPATSSLGYISEDPDSFSRSVLASRVIENLLNYMEEALNLNFINEYRRRCFILGKYITVASANTSSGSEKAYLARAIDVDESGGLVVEFMEGPRMREMVTLTSGEVNLKEEE